MSSMPCATYKKLKTLPFRSWNQQWNYVAKLIRHKKSIFLTDLRHIVHQEVTIRLFLLLIILLKIQLSQHQLQKKVILCGSSGLILCKFNKQCFDQLSLRKKKNILTGSVFRRHYIEKKKTPAQCSSFPSKIGLNFLIIKTTYSLFALGDLLECNMTRLFDLKRGESWLQLNPLVKMSRKPLLESWLEWTTF